MDWFTIIQSIGIISGLIFTAYALLSTRKGQRVATLLQITQYHREIWGRLFDFPELQRVLDPKVDIKHHEITAREKLFVSLIILHLSCVLEAASAGIMVPLEQLQKDIQDFFSLPIPKQVWADMRKYQNQNLIGFVEQSLR